jgi:excisionase family DNA binding protein
VDPSTGTVKAEERRMPIARPRTVAALAAMPSPEERSWDVPGVAAFLRVSDSTIRRMVRDGALPYFRVGAQLRFDPARLRAWRGATERTIPRAERPLRRPRVRSTAQAAASSSTLP